VWFVSSVDRNRIVHAVNGNSATDDLLLQILQGLGRIEDRLEAIEVRLSALEKNPLGPDFPGPVPIPHSEGFQTLPSVIDRSNTFVDVSLLVPEVLPRVESDQLMSMDEILQSPLGRCYSLVFQSPNPFNVGGILSSFVDNDRDSQYVYPSKHLFQEYILASYSSPLTKERSYLGDAYIYFMLRSVDKRLIAEHGSNRFIVTRFSSYDLGPGNVEHQADRVEAALAASILDCSFPLDQIQLLVPASVVALTTIHADFMTTYFSTISAASSYLPFNRLIKARSSWK